MTSIPISSSAGIIGLKVVQVDDASGDFIPVINIENIAGLQGPQGEQGEQGPIGPQGPPGPPLPFMVLPKATDYELSIGDVGKIFTIDDGAREINLFLPSPTPGLHYYFIAGPERSDSEFGMGEFGTNLFGEGLIGGLTVIADSLSTIALGNRGNAFQTVSSNSAFAALHLVALTTAKWVALSITGNWLGSL